MTGGSRASRLLAVALAVGALQSLLAAPAQAATLGNNSFEGGTNGTTISTANSGGLSGDAWDTVSIGSGATATYDTSGGERAFAFAPELRRRRREQDDLAEAGEFAHQQGIAKNLPQFFQRDADGRLRLIQPDRGARYIALRHQGHKHAQQVAVDGIGGSAHGSVLLFVGLHGIRIPQFCL